MNSDIQEWPDRITVNPDICNGKPTIRGMRISVQTILGFLASGDKPEDILAEYPFLDTKDIHACLALQRSQSITNLHPPGFEKGG